MPTQFTNGTLTISKAMTSTLAQRLINGVLGANNVSTIKDDGTALTNAEKMAAFDTWLWRHLKNDAKSWEALQAAATTMTAAEAEIP